jgi:phage shock protein E
LLLARLSLSSPHPCSCCLRAESDLTTPPSAPTATQDGASSGVRALPPAEALALVEERGPVVLDVRTPQEYATGHLTEARNVALGDDFARAVASLPRTGTYVLYCTSGNRSARAASIMAELGFTDVVDAGGLNDLAGAGGRVVT